MRRFRFLQPLAVGLMALGVSLVPAQPSYAQYLGSNFHGDFGVNSGTQPGPGVYLIVPYLQWNVDEIKDADGNTVAARLFEGFDIRAVPPTLIVVTPKTIFGATYGLMVALPISTIRPERAIAQLNQPGWDVNDLYVVPLYLGWRLPRADFVAGYGFYAPTGRYEVNGDDNVGLGMWGHEIQAGTTVYLDAGKKFSAATTAYFELHSNKKDQDLKVGNLLTLEGGLAYNVPQIGGAFGLGYYLQRKLSNDSGADLPLAALSALNLYGKNTLFGIGPDVTMALFQKGRTIGLVSVRYLWESAGKSSFEGSTFAVGFTIARPRG